MIKTDTLSYLKNCISSPTDAAETMQSFIVKSDPKHLMLIYMNGQKNLLIYNHSL